MRAVSVIVRARLHDLAAIPAIELAAARLLVGHAPQSVLSETTSRADLEQAHRDGHLWVALANDTVVGFAHLAVLEPGVVHLEEIDVDPRYGRRGIGTALVRRVCAWAAAAGFAAVTLTTFREVPWNMPRAARPHGSEAPGCTDMAAGP